MVGKGAPSSSSPSPSSPSTNYICCMCGDHGLPQELFRCRVCHFRSQHKYCSDLYPKAEAYRACNWCLRDEGGKPLARESLTSSDINNNNNNNSNSNSALSPRSPSNGIKLHRGSFQPTNKPIKKQRLPERSVSDLNGRMRSEEISPRLAKSRQAFRGKVRRYKLLEEVSS